jgi:60S ribosome subunit biogenesis protein NIP7
MRALTPEETEQLFKKLAKYIGANTKHLIEPRDGEQWVFRLHGRRVWYMPARLEKAASTIARKNMLACGTLIAKVTHNDHMRIQVTALDLIAQYSTFKLWVKPTQEQGFMYGSHVSRAGLGRITEDTPQYQGVAVFNMADVPMGFGVAALGTMQCRKCEMNSTVLFHESDVGEYLRNEATLT